MDMALVSGCFSFVANVADWVLPFKYSSEIILPIASRLHATLDPVISLNSCNQEYSCLMK